MIDFSGIVLHLSPKTSGAYRKRMMLKRRVNQQHLRPDRALSHQMNRARDCNRPVNVNARSVDNLPARRSNFDRQRE